MTEWWQNLPSGMKPEIFRIGNFAVQWYGMMYLLAFITVYLLASRRLKTEKGFHLDNEGLQNLMVVLILGVLVGGRLGYVIFYNLGYYLRHPLQIIMPFDIADGWRFTGISGMSFHGGLIGVILGALIHLRRQKISFLRTADLIIPCIPLGYTSGRLGNFLKGELYGRVTEASIGMMFPMAPGADLRHPSQLYEAFFEGIVLWIILWFFRKKLRPDGASLAAYLIGYGVFRFFIEYTRQPDEHLGFVFRNFSMGQMLCLGMILAGAVLWYALIRHEARRRSAGPAR